MPYKDILVQVDHTAAGGRRAQVAAALARRHGAELTGVFLRPSFPVQSFTAGSYGVLPPVVTPKLIARYEEAIDQGLDAARAAFEHAVRASGVASDWLAIDGDTPKAMLQCMRRADLTIFPRDRLETVAEYGLEPGQLALAGGAPMLVLPDMAADRPLGRRVLVAWNGSREAARALRDAWPLLDAAEEVVVLIVSPHGDAGPPGMLQRHFEHHRRPVRLIVERAPDASAGQTLLKQIDALEIDLVVMGLYGHTRLREFVLGGASRELLKGSPAPLFVAH